MPRKSYQHSSNFKDMTGKVCGRLTVIRGFGLNKDGRYQWLCKCECGNEVTVVGKQLRKGTKSCGCLRIARNSEAKRTHNASKNLVYRVWKSMRARCNCSTDKSYPNYGGRGIRVCDKWSGQNGYENFIADMGPRPEGMSIERLNNNGNYEPGNCKWATRAEQNRNSRRNIFVEYQGEKMIVKDAAKKMGVDYYTLITRVKTNGPCLAESPEPVGEKRKSRKARG